MSMNNNKSFVNSNKDVYKKYIAQLFANSIATIEPKIVIKNNELQEEWNKLTKNINLIQINYLLVNEISQNGNAVLFLTNYFEKLKIFVSRISNIKYDNKLNIKSYDLELIIPEINNQTILVCKESDEYKYSYKFFIENNICSHVQIMDNLPFAYFTNNPLNLSDLSNVDPLLIEEFNKHLDLLLSDSLTSKSLFHLNTPLSQANSKNINQLKDVLNNPRGLIFENQNIFSLLQSGGLQIQQGLSIYLAILEKIKFYDNKIKELAFAPRNTLDAGTKNIHSTEANQINSQSDDYIELKANLLEISWTNFIRYTFFDYLKNNNDQFNDIDFESVEIDVEICGSTKYLKNIQNEYVQNQSGSLINPNKINQIQNQGELNEKEKN